MPETDNPMNPMDPTNPMNPMNAPSVECVGVIGLGYVGVSLAVFVGTVTSTILFDSTTIRSRG